MVRGWLGSPCEFFEQPLFGYLRRWFDGLFDNHWSLKLLVAKKINRQPGHIDTR